MVKISSIIFGDVTIAIRRKPRFKIVIRKPVPWDKRNPNYREKLPNRPNLFAATNTFAVALKGIEYVKKKPKEFRRLTDDEFKAKVVELRAKAIAKRNELMSGTQQTS